MSLHESIVVDMQRMVEEQDADIITPASLAIAVHKKYSGRWVEPHIEYASLEHMKSIARKVLAGRYDAEGEENEAHQGELFAGRLQARYPVPRKKDEDPVYKKLEALTSHELRWNIGTLRRSAEARLEHADALEAWAQRKAAA